MKLKSGALAFTAAAAMFGLSANATVITVQGVGELTPTSGAYESFDGFALGASCFNSIELDASFCGTGTLRDPPTISGISAVPYTDRTRYLSILGGAATTITFSGDNSAFGLYWGSIDSYNSITFYSGGVQVDFVTGADLIPTLLSGAFGAQGEWGANRYVTIVTDAFFDRVVLASSQNSFELDNISVTAVPEPGTLALIGLGLAGIAGIGRRRKS